MKLVIDIPEEMYKRIQDDIYSTYDGVDSLKAVRNGTPLDDIRKEINDLPKTYPFINHIDTYVKTEDVIRIIDRHIGSNDAEWKESEPLDDVVELIGKEQ